MFYTNLNNQSLFSVHYIQCMLFVQQVQLLLLLFNSYNDDSYATQTAFGLHTVHIYSNEGPCHSMQLPGEILY